MAPPHAGPLPETSFMGRENSILKFFKRYAEFGTSPRSFALSAIGVVTFYLAANDFISSSFYSSVFNDAEHRGKSEVGIPGHIQKYSQHYPSYLRILIYILLIWPVFHHFIFFGVRRTFFRKRLTRRFVGSSLSRTLAMGFVSAFSEGLTFTLAALIFFGAMNSGRNAFVLRGMLHGDPDWDDFSKVWRWIGHVTMDNVNLTFDIQSPTKASVENLIFIDQHMIVFCIAFSISAHCLRISFGVDFLLKTLTNC